MPRRTTGERAYILQEKLRAPNVEGILQRPRINEILTRSIGQFPATLISGRAGTGKTALVSSLTAESAHISWYSVESNDIDWPVFSQYFAASLAAGVSGRFQGAGPMLQGGLPHQSDIAHFLLNCFSAAYSEPSRGPSLIILDDIHHVFDAVWFEDFFTLLIHSLPPDTHLLLLGRSKPPGPLWRLRSKQMLNVLDEKVIAFTEDEAAALFEMMCLAPSGAKEANDHCFGRISKLLEFAREQSAELSPLLS